MGGGAPSYQQRCTAAMPGMMPRTTLSTPCCPAGAARSATGRCARGADATLHDYWGIRWPPP